MEPSTRPEQTSRDEVGQVRVRARERCHPPGGGTPQDSSRDVLQDVHICTFGPFGPYRSSGLRATILRAVVVSSESRSRSCGSSSASRRRQSMYAAFRLSSSTLSPNRTNAYRRPEMPRRWRRWGRLGGEGGCGGSGGIPNTSRRMSFSLWAKDCRRDSMAR